MGTFPLLLLLLVLLLSFIVVLLPSGHWLEHRQCSYNVVDVVVDMWFAGIFFQKINVTISQEDVGHLCSLLSSVKEFQLHGVNNLKLGKNLKLGV